MKKIYLYSFAACLGLSLMACDGYKEPNPPAQSNPQLPILQTADVTVSNTLTSSYNLPALFEEGASIKLATVECDKLGEGYTFGAMAFISANDFENSYNVPVTSEKIDAQNVWELYISPSALSDIYHENISWDNDEATISIRYNLTTVYDSGNGTQVAYVGGSDKFYGPYTLSITPIEGSVSNEEPGNTDYDFDYLYTPGKQNGWSFDNNMLLSTTDHKTYTGFVYLLGNDPEANDNGFKFTAGAGWDLNWGVGEDGNLEENGENITIEQTGLYYASVDLSSLKFNLVLIENIEMIGGFCGWGEEGSVYMTGSDDYRTWTGELTISSEEDGADNWKFRMNNSWDINLGASGDEEPVAVTPDQAYDLSWGGKNFSLPVGTYSVTLDLSKLPYTTTVEAK